MKSEITRGLDALGGVSALAPLDLAMEHIRARMSRLLPLYVIAAAPLTITALYAFDAVSVQDRRLLPALSVLLALSTIWRWGWLAALQRRVQEDLRREPVMPLRSRLWAILYHRLVAAMLLTWGSILVLPGLYGFFLGSFAAPQLLEEDGPAAPILKRGLGLINRFANRLLRASFALAVGLLLIVVGVAALQFFFVGTILGSLAGLDITSLAMTFRSSFWLLASGLALFLAFDFFWSVAAVMTYYDLQSRRLGTDLRRRLQELAREGA